MLLTRLGAGLACWLYRFLLLTGKPYRVPKGMEWRTNKEVLRLVTGRRQSRDGGRGPRGHGQKSESKEESVLGPPCPGRGHSGSSSRTCHDGRRAAYRQPLGSGRACDRVGESRGRADGPHPLRLALLLVPGGPLSSGQCELWTVRSLPHQRSPFGTGPVPTLKTPGPRAVPPQCRQLSLRRCLIAGCASAPDGILSGAF